MANYMHNMHTYQDALPALLMRAIYDLEHGWVSAAVDALGRALRLIDLPQTDAVATSHDNHSELSDRYTHGTR